MREVVTNSGVSWFPLSSELERVRNWAKVSSDFGSPRKEEKGEEFWRLVESEVKCCAVDNEGLEAVDVLLGSRAFLLTENDLLAPGLGESDLDSDGPCGVVTLVELIDLEEAVRLVE
jgi:hypothetical protein